jgi:hypothetical protein
MSVLLLSYPTVSEQDDRWVREIHLMHDQAYRDIVEPHFTLIFPVDGFPIQEAHTHVRENIAGQLAIQFVCRCATVVPDAFSDDWFVFLVPDEGYSEIVKLHDRLYVGPLSHHLRLDLPFIPHIGVKTSKDRFACKQLADDLNSRGFALPGSLNTLTLCSFDGHRISNIEAFPLG